MKTPHPLLLSKKGIQEKEHSSHSQSPQNHLQTLLDGFVDFRGNENFGLTFKGLSINSKKVHEEYLFLACAGTSTRHGIAYAGDAINRGANCIAWEPTSEIDSMPASCVVKDKPDVPLIQVEALHEKVGEIAARFYQHPSRTLDVIGVTGTNGKTSTTHFIAQLIHIMHLVRDADDDTSGRCAVIGTLGNGLYGELEESTHTTPDAVTLQALLADFRDQKADTVVMEVSSHALSQDRVKGIEFDTAVFTNLTRDHLDYHGDMKRYADEKLKLFGFPSLKHIILNQDDVFASEIVEFIRSISDRNQADRTNRVQPGIVRYSRKDKSCEFYARDIVLNREGISFSLCVSEKQGQDDTQVEFRVNSHLVGDFNIDNLLAAIAVLHQQGYELTDIVSAIPEVTTVPGRMEKIAIEQNDTMTSEYALIVVDYAHTPDALEKSLKALKAHTQGKLFCVFGCGGDRDKGKRPLMAKIAQTQADHIMVTSDNPRSESAEQIIADIVAGFNTMDNVFTETDREQAIKTVLRSASADDVVLIAGKGHEDYQEINGQRIPFSDKKCVLSLLTEGDEF